MRQKCLTFVEPSLKNLSLELDDITLLGLPDGSSVHTRYLPENAYPADTEKSGQGYEMTRTIINYFYCSLEPMRFGVNSAFSRLCTSSSSGSFPDHVHIQDTEEFFVPKTSETEDSQNCSTPKVKTNGSECLHIQRGPQNLSGSLGVPVPSGSADNIIHNGEVFEFVKKNKHLDSEALVDAFIREFGLFHLDADTSTIYNRLMNDVYKKVVYKLRSAKKSRIPETRIQNTKIKSSFYFGKKARHTQERTIKERITTVCEK